MARLANESFKETSDMVYDNVCTPCADKGLNAEGLFFCRKCCKQFCSPCKDLHDRLFNNHPVLTQTERSLWGAVKQESTLLICEQHDGKDVEMYCEDHDVVICSTCVSLKHRACTSIKHLPDVANGVLITPAFKSLPFEVNKATLRLTEKATTWEKNLITLQEKFKQIVDSIDELEKALIEQLAKLKKEVLGEMNKTFSTQIRTIDEEIAKCKKINESLKKTIKEIKAKGEQDEVFCFAGLNKCQKMMREAGNVLSALGTGNHVIEFKLDTEMERFLSTATFGKFETGKKVASGHMYKIKNKVSYNVKIAEDTELCCITDCCFLPSGQLVINDAGDNKRVKLLSKQFKVISYYDCENIPYSLCQISGSEVCVACWDHLQLLFVYEDKLKPGRKVDINHNATSVAHYEGLLYVGGFDHWLHIYTATGQFVKQVYTGFVQRFSLGPSRMIYITTWKKSQLIVLDDQGTIKSTFTNASVKGTTGLFVFSHENVLVCGCDTNNIVQVDSQGQHLLSTLLTSADGMSKPLSVCYNETSHTLLVGAHENDTILAVELEKVS